MPGLSRRLPFSHHGAFRDWQRCQLWHWNVWTFNQLLTGGWVITTFCPGLLLSYAFTMLHSKKNPRIDQNSFHLDACASNIASLEVCGIAIQLGQIVHDLWGRGADLARQLHLLGGGQVRVLEHQVAVHDAATRIAQVASRAPDCAEHWTKKIFEFFSKSLNYIIVHRYKWNIYYFEWWKDYNTVHIEKRGHGMFIMNSLPKKMINRC